jgi:hypothetical protein
MKITQTGKRKPIAEGVPSFGVSRSMRDEPTVNARTKVFDETKGDYRYTYAEFSISELRAMLAMAEATGMVKQWDSEQVQSSIRIIDKGYELLDDYRGFHIGSKGVGKIGVYKNGETYTMTYLSSVPQARGYIDRLIKSGFIEWFDRYTEARASRGLKAPPSQERAGAAYRSGRDPEDLALDDLLDASRYSVEEQQDRTWAIMNGGGFVQGGYPDRGEAVFEAKQRIAADIECGVPVIREVAEA